MVNATPIIHGKDIRFGRTPDTSDWGKSAVSLYVYGPVVTIIMEDVPIIPHSKDLICRRRPDIPKKFHCGAAHWSPGGAIVMKDIAITPHSKDIRPGNTREAQ